MQWHIETFIEISCHLYDFIKCFNVSLHLDLLYEMLQWYWNIYWYENSWFNVEEIVHGVVALQEGYGIMTDDIQRIDWYVGSVCVKL